MADSPDIVHPGLLQKENVKAILLLICLLVQQIVAQHKIDCLKKEHEKIGTAE
jgi:hypothetical protein